ncbi:uncharacterized protein K489DRAFT_376419 [Dissoconium aciculare CBS 342.82]|uniref:Uncharacterized protein n=1 Tax=Dissoconium aciculare CBS 342.82 TaxID=1314786 RepID=A0A6J3MDS0_9PEZI|nr:uncharacterized protein K489DRAFT_376419 [Dissoconium aciculare CBS 342.82]KAF1826023.1 hypothetical protein K489DRAFT_376419 [Dissoconium aciculare CBS 342.82]
MDEEYSSPSRQQRIILLKSLPESLSPRRLFRRSNRRPARAPSSEPFSPPPHRDRGGLSRYSILSSVSFIVVVFAAAATVCWHRIFLSLDGREVLKSRKARNAGVSNQQLHWQHTQRNVATVSDLTGRFSGLFESKKDFV